MRKLNSIDRVKLTLQHKESDRIPLDIGGTRVTGIQIDAYRYYRKMLGLKPSHPEMKVLYQQLPKIDEDFYKLLDVDLESVDPVTTSRETRIKKDATGDYYTDMWGCEWFKPKGNDVYNIRKHPLADADSVRDINIHKWPNRNFKDMLENFENDAIEVFHNRKRAIVIGRTCPGIFEMCANMCGMEKSMMDLALTPKIPEAIMEHILEHKLNFYRNALEKIKLAGIDYIILSEADDLGTQDGLLISPGLYRKMIKPKHTFLFSEIKKYFIGQIYIELHCCGSIRELIPDFIEAGVDILNPVQISAKNMNAKKLKEEFGKDITFHGGGIDMQNTLPFGTIQDIENEVRRNIKDLAPGGGFIFAHPQSIQSDVPFINFKAMVDSFHKYGRY